MLSAWQQNKRTISPVHTISVRTSVSSRFFFTFRNMGAFVEESALSVVAMAKLQEFKKAILRYKATERAQPCAARMCVISFK